jgi:deuterolysin
MDLAESHDVLDGGVHDVIAKGDIAFAALNSSEIIGSIPYESNQLSIDINGTMARSQRDAFHKLVARAQIDSTCSSSRSAILQTAFANCAKYASAAATAATSGSATK